MQTSSAAPRPSPPDGPVSKVRAAAAPGASPATGGSWWAPAAFILIWSSGYVVAKAAAPHAQPLTFLSVRYLGVVALMAVLAWVARAPWPKPPALWRLALSGVGIQAIYLGGVWVAIRQGMGAGLAALIVNLQPVLMAALAPLVHEKVRPRQWLGVLLGLAGVALVVAHKLGQAALSPGPVALCVMALAGITAGTLYQKRKVPNFDLRAGQAVQFAASLAVTLPLAAWYEGTDLGASLHWNGSLIASMLWSVVVLSAGGISLMFHMLRHGQVTAVTSTMYLVPSVTALMAWAMFGETPGALAAAGMAVTLLGVYLVVSRR